MEKHKSKKINEVINKYGSTLNLHEIKAITGAGNGHKNTNIPVDSNIANTEVINSNKIEKIYDAIANINGRVNLHKIKEQTGAGNGYNYFTTINSSINTTNDVAQAHNHKSNKITDLLLNSNKKLNLHQIKSQTGAGSGYRN